MQSTTAVSFLVLLALNITSHAQDFTHFEVYQKMNPGIFRIFETFLESIDEKNDSASLCLQRSADQIKCMPCIFESNKSSAAATYEQYTCTDSMPGNKTVLRTFKFSPGISESSHLKGKVEIHKDEKPSVTVSYRKVP